MLIAELVNSFSHEPVARAAVLSLGLEFFMRVESAACSLGQSAGSYAARRVMRFADRADDAQWLLLSRVMAGEDMPLLSGLQYILERDLERHESADDEKQFDEIPPECLYRAAVLRKAQRWF